MPLNPSLHRRTTAYRYVAFSNGRTAKFPGEPKRYVYEAIRKIPFVNSMILRFESMNAIGSTFTVSQGYHKKDGQVQDSMGAINRGMLHYRLSTITIGRHGCVSETRHSLRS
jgi:hypothetical protein